MNLYADEMHKQSKKIEALELKDKQRKDRVIILNKRIIELVAENRRLKQVIEKSAGILMREVNRE